MKAMGKLIVALLVLALVGAGSVEAARLITGKQIRNGSIGVKDLSKKTRAKLKGNRGPQGPAGPAGPQGATGATGATGAAGATNVVVRKLVQGAVTDGSAFGGTANCQAGERVVGGGAVLIDTGTDQLADASILLYSAPTVQSLGSLEVPDAGAVPNAWKARILNDTGSAKDAHVFAVCASP